MLTVLPHSSSITVKTVIKEININIREPLMGISNITSEPRAVNIKPPEDGDTKLP